MLNLLKTKEKYHIYKKKEINLNFSARQINYENQESHLFVRWFFEYKT